MCGIHIVFDRKRLHGEAPIRKMLMSITHRGPDHANFMETDFQGGKLYIGVNRLKVSDLSDYSNQPFQNLPEGDILSYNGEIYNQHSLRNDLINVGCRFGSSSDTEVVFHYLRHYGLKGIQELNGMFALVFFNSEHQSLIIARDRFGIKPLFYYENENILILSSEIRGILASGLVQAKLNASQIPRYLSKKYAQPPETFYRDIFEVPPNARVSWRPGLSLQALSSRIEQSDEPKSNEVIEDPVAVTKQLLRDSLLNTLESAVPLGILLSGGVDSTLLLALAQECGYSVPSYTITAGNRYSSFSTADERYASSAANKYNSPHTAIRIDDAILDDFDAHVCRLDQPIGDSSTLLTEQICRHASKSVTVLLSGAGADELFAGYNRHAAFYYYLKHRRFLVSNRKGIDFMTRLLPDGIDHPLRNKWRLIRKFITSIDPDPGLTFGKMSGLSISSAGGYENQPFRIHPDQYGMTDHVMARALEHDRNNYLVSDVLALTDRMSMLHGVEVRVPYLNKELVGFIEGLNATVLLKGGKKWILKDILQTMGGREFATRSKEGFGLPIGSWIRSKKHAYLWEPLRNNNSMIFDFIDKNETDTIMRRHLKKQADFGQEIWALMVLAHWLRRAFD